MVKTIGNVQKDAQIRAVASGALSNGDTVIVNSDGTVSAVVETPISQAIGSPSAFESGNGAYQIACTFDSNANRVVVIYQDTNNSQYGTAVVGTISGTSISFGTPVVFQSVATTDTTATYDSNNNKVVIAYAGTNFNAYSRVGTVSGTSISFGSQVTLDSNSNNRYMAATFDSTNNKVVIVYTRTSANVGYAVVGTVSGTSISFGGLTNFATTNSAHHGIGFDSTNGKVVVSYKDSSNSNYFTAKVGTVSGTSISFGSGTVIESATLVGDDNSSAIAFDSSSGKIIIAYVLDDGTQYPKAIVGTVSGTSISFGSAATIDSVASGFVTCNYDISANKITVARQDYANNARGLLNSGTVSGTSISFGSSTVFETGNFGPQGGATYDSVSGKVVIAYMENDVSTNAGQAVVFQNSYNSTNLTSDNFIGFAAHSYADTQSAVINTTCTVDRNQTSLTAGQKYYVQTDGALGLTPADPSVEAGTAISSTEILVKG